jgi:hypothetical protein
MLLCICNLVHSETNLFKSVASVVTVFSDRGHVAVRNHSTRDSAEGVLDSALLLTWYHTSSHCNRKPLIFEKVKNGMNTGTIQLMIGIITYM